MNVSSIYRDFFGLREKPYNVTPDPKFLCLTEKHQEALDHLVYGLEQKIGFLMLVGEVGAGKTMICRALLEKLDERYITALILHPFLAEEDLLANILQDLGLSPRGRSKREMLDQLNGFILDRKAEGKTVVLIFDESQNLSPEVLEEIRILSNLETDQEKLIQIILIGQKELEAKLARKELRQLNQRIGVRYYLYPLNRRETERYLNHRLLVAGDTGSIQFTRGAIREINAFSRGIPRLINLAADRALLAGYVQETKAITRKMARKGIASLSGRLEAGNFWGGKEALSPVSLVVMVLIVIGGFMVLWLGSEYLNWWGTANKIVQIIPAGFIQEQV
ncbi:MAG: AAA family ATPase [Deltaproteobacteria bacterium]|nr:AAA family ATPase [Deltaproteobacteria bacterium]